VLVSTVRALKSHGGGPAVEPGKPLDAAYTRENVDLVKAGVGNMQHHIRNIAKFGVRAVVAVNRFATDSDAEIAIVRAAALEAGAAFAVEANHWADGGAGARDLAAAVMSACAAARAESAAGGSGGAGGFRFLYPLEMGLKDKITTIATQIYGADGVRPPPGHRGEMGTKGANH